MLNIYDYITYGITDRERKFNYVIEQLDQAVELTGFNL